MSNKQFDKLNIIDQKLRKAFPPESFIQDSEQVQVIIRKKSGFELFNTRSYHNYETWSDGYYGEVLLKDGTKIEASAEDLDDCITDLIAKYHQHKAQS